MNRCRAMNGLMVCVEYQKEGYDQVVYHPCMRFNRAIDSAMKLSFILEDLIIRPLSNVQPKPYTQLYPFIRSAYSTHSQFDFIAHHPFLTRDFSIPIRNKTHFEVQDLRYVTHYQLVVRFRCDELNQYYYISF